MFTTASKYGHVQKRKLYIVGTRFEHAFGALPNWETICWLEKVINICYQNLYLTTKSLLSMFVTEICY